MPWRRWLLTLALCLGTPWLTGCGKLPFGGSAANDEGEEFAELDEFDDESSADETTDAPAESTGPDDFSQATADVRELALQLPVGARFPLIKTVEQRLTQQLATGPAVGQTRLELRMTLLVEEERPQARRLSVRYHKVRYSQNLGGEPLEYDSDQPPAVIPPAALAYSGLRDNGFSFWLGADNRILELVDFPEFLRRCVASIAPEQRNGVLQQLAALRSEDGIASFVDDSIGLLPNPADPQLSGQPLRVGSSWDLRPGLSSAARSGSGMRCLLKNLTPQVAEIALVGMIEPSNYVDDQQRLKLTVQGGQCSGTCLVDRQTGLPTQSRIDRVIDMVAELADGTQIPQRKEVVTTMTAYVDQAGFEPAAGVSQVGYQR